MSQKSVTWDVNSTNQFKHVYDAACKGNALQFTYGGNEFVTSYARYLLQYLASQLGSNSLFHDGQEITLHDGKKGRVVGRVGYGKGTKNVRVQFEDDSVKDYDQNILFTLVDGAQL